MSGCLYQFFTDRDTVCKWQIAPWGDGGSQTPQPIKKVLNRVLIMVNINVASS